MSKRRIIQERKLSKSTEHKESKKIIVPVSSQGWNSMTNWLTVLCFVLPILFSRVTLDPAITVRYIFIGAFILLFLLFFYAYKKINFILTTPVKIVFALGIAFGLWSILCLTYAINPSTGYYEIARHFLNTILLFLVFVAVQKEEQQLLQVCKAILLMSLVQSIVGIMQYYELSFTDIPGSDPKPYGLMANRNLFGSAQAFLLPFILFVLYSASKTWKYISMAAIGGIVVSVLVSQTRSAWLASAGIFIFSLVLVLLFSDANRKRWIVGTLLSVPLIALLTVSIIISDKEGTFTKSIKQRAENLIKVPTDTSKGASEEGGGERLKMWNKTAALIKDHSLLGVGTGNWKIAIPIYDSTGLIWSTGKFVPTRPHNVYLEIASETGIPGAILYFSIWVVISIIAFIIIRNPVKEHQRILTILMLSGLAGFAIDCMFSFPTERIEHSLYIYLMAGIILGIYSNSEATKIQRQPGKTYVAIFIIITLFNIFIGYKKYNFEKHMNYAKAYENNKNYQDELTEVEEGKSDLVTIDLTGQPLQVRSSIAYKELKDYKNALLEINTAKKYNPNSPMIFNNTGIIYTEMQEYNKAIENYLKALKLAPQMDMALKNLAVNYFNIKNYSACIEALHKIEEREADSTLLNNLENEAKRRLALQTLQPKK